MSVLSDRQIRELASRYGMISPFEAGQVKTNPTTGEKVISYGVSSYGYDARCSYKFKIFQPEVSVRRLTESQAGYVAGVLDGEGWIGRHNATQVNSSTYAIRVGNTNKEMLDRLQNTIGTGAVYKCPPPKKKKHNQAWMYALAKQSDVEALLGQVLPYLTVKYEDARAALLSNSKRSIVVDPKNFNTDTFTSFEGEVCVIPPNSFALASTVERFKIPRNVLVTCLGKSTYARCGIIVNVTPLEPEWEGFVTLEFSNTSPLPARIYAGEGAAQFIFHGTEEECEVSYKDRGGKYQGQGDEPRPPTV